MIGLYLILPPSPLPDEANLLARLLATAPAAALLVPRGQLAENAYKARVKALVGPAQQRDCAVLIEGEPGWVRLLGADGLHVGGDSAAVRSAMAALKPDLIVGASAGNSRHDAMELGELDVDYILFGPFSGAIDPVQRDLARWWAETMEIPAVLSDPEAQNLAADEGCEFLALSASVFAAADPEAALAAILADAEVGD